MFLYELARDSRTASIFAGITPMVGLPAYGFNFGPTSPISFFGSWGLKDDVVPPEVGASALNCTLPCRTSQSNGWFYESSECTTDEWQDVYKVSIKLSTLATLETVRIQPAGNISLQSQT